VDRALLRPIPNGVITSCFTSTSNGDNGVGLGASHQTGWTGIVAKLIELYGFMDAELILKEGKKSAFALRKKAT
jgi:hypothetical protein